MVKVKRDEEVTVCDFCGRTVHEESKCAVCGKDLCDRCDAVGDITFRAYAIRICPEDRKSMTLDKYVEVAEKELARLGVT